MNGNKNNPPSRGSRYYQGQFPITECKKYEGDPPIIYRSSWEYKFMLYCERNPHVIKWSSEPFHIKYKNPFDKKLHKYYPDFYIKKDDGSIIIIEIKPKKYTKKPRKPSKETKKNINRYNEELKNYRINSAKWKYAIAYCNQFGWKFSILTETFFDKIKT